MLKIYKKITKSLVKHFTIFVESSIISLSKGKPLDLIKLIIFPLIIYYSKSIKRCLMLFEFLKGYLRRISALRSALLVLRTKSTRHFAMLTRLDLLATNPLRKDNKTDKVYLIQNTSRALSCLFLSPLTLKVYKHRRASLTDSPKQSQ